MNFNAWLTSGESAESRVEVTERAEADGLSVCEAAGCTVDLW